MTAIDRRDLSQLSAILATATTSAPKPKRARPAPANDNRPVKATLAWPALERLAHRGDMARAFALRHWRNLVNPGSGYEAIAEAEDIEEAGLEIRPTEAGTLRAIGWNVTGQGRWPHTGKLVPTYERDSEVEPVTTRNRLGGTDTRFGDLLFRDGKLISWGTTAKGRDLKPVERASGVKGGQAVGRSAAAVWSYLRLAGATSPLSAKHLHRLFAIQPVVRDCYEPLPAEAPSAKDPKGRFGVEEARAVLKQLGVDGSVPFERLPVPAKREADALLAAGKFVGGVKHPKPLGEISAAAGREPAVMKLVETRSHLSYLRHHLGDHARVLDLAIANTSAKDIGVAMGLSESYAEKRGPALIDAAIDALLAVDETARTIEETKIAA